MSDNATLLDRCRARARNLGIAPGSTLDDICAALIRSHGRRLHIERTSLRAAHGIWTRLDCEDLYLLPAAGTTFCQPLHDLAHLAYGHTPTGQAADLSLTPDLTGRALGGLAGDFTAEQEREAAAMQAVLTELGVTVTS